MVITHRQLGSDGRVHPAMHLLCDAESQQADGQCRLVSHVGRRIVGELRPGRIEQARVRPIVVSGSSAERSCGVKSSRPRSRATARIGAGIRARRIAASRARIASGSCP